MNLAASILGLERAIFDPINHTFIEFVYISRDTGNAGLAKTSVF